MVAITVFFLLSVAFYAFFAPFLGKDIYEYIAIGIYSFLVSATGASSSSIFEIMRSLSLSLSPVVAFLFLLLSFQALCVFILYVRCTAIDPADPGILIEPDKTLTHRSQNNSEFPGKFFIAI